MIIGEMRLRKRFKQDGMGGEKNYCKNTEILAKASVKVFTSVVRL